MVKKSVKKSIKKRRLSRLKESVSVASFIPNAITALAMCAGITAIRFAIEEHYNTALALIALAALLDALDGRMARLLDSSSQFGAELDSLADAISFGVAPALILYFWGLNEFAAYGWAAALFYAICAVLRLARFNTNLTSWPPYAYNYFQGMPSPAAAGVVLMPMTGEIAFGLQFSPEFITGWLIITALLMVSSIPTYSFKGARLTRGAMFAVLVVLLFLISNALVRPWQTLFVFMCVYVLLTPLSWVTFNRLRKEAERIQDDDQ